MADAGCATGPNDGTNALAVQRTILKPAEMTGRGLFTGARSTLRVRPASPYSGISFVRVDQPKPVRVAARVENVSKRARRTSLRNGTVTIETVEHCLSACSGLGIDNLDIELAGDELPGGDGSSLPFVSLLQEAGTCDQDVECEAYVIPDLIRVTDGDSEVLALPPLSAEDDGLDILYDLDYGDATPIGRQLLSARITPEFFVREIAPARTFVLEAEAEALRKSGLGTHLDYSDVVVFGPNGPIQNELRFTNECVRHKILDLVGDLALIGKRLIGRIFARKSGHVLNHEVVRAILKLVRQRQARDAVLERPVMNIQRVHRVLPHRYPLLMIDRILHIEGTTRAVGLKNVTINEPFFQGHYPGQPIMPGVLIIEAMAQIGGILLAQELEHKGKIAVLLSLDKVKFRRSVQPGDQLVLVAEAIRVTSRGGHLKCHATVGADLVSEAVIKFAMTDADSGSIDEQ